MPRRLGLARGAAGYATLTAVLASGSLLGALLSARRPGTRLRELVILGVALCAAAVVASAITSKTWFTISLIPLGAATLWFLSAANAAVQTRASDAIRGRVMSLYLLMFIGSGAAGGPVIGRLDEIAGPRTGLCAEGIVPFVATLLMSAWIAYAIRRWSFG